MMLIRDRDIDMMNLINNKSIIRQWVRERYRYDVDKRQRYRYDKPNQQ